MKKMGPDFNRCSTCTHKKLEVMTVLSSSVFGTLTVTTVAPSTFIPSCPSPSLAQSTSSRDKCLHCFSL